VGIGEGIGEDDGPQAGRPAGGGGRVVVGVDGSPGSRAALGYALGTARRRGAELEVVAGYAPELYWMSGAPVAVPDVSALRDDTRELALELLHEVAAELGIPLDAGEDPVRTRVVVSGEPAVVELLRRSADAGLLVVGSRGRGAVASVLLGSVALHCVTHARCPVVVVHPAAEPPARPPRVVVGLDVSDAARAALAAAVEEAAGRGAVVEVVAAYALADRWTELYPVLSPPREEVRADLRGAAEAMVAAVLAERPEGAAVPAVRIEVVEGAPSVVLVEAARGAELLVVGSRGRGALRGILMGSVALHCVMHAPSPVMVVHPADEHEPATALAGSSSSAPATT
jgi:nucleotide-binding universal stress UspA family protein